MVDKTKAFVGNMFLEIGGVGSPTPYMRICEYTAISGLGKTNAQVDSTDFCSGGTREYIPGLAEGSELTIDAKYIVSSAVRRQLKTAVDLKSVVSLRMVVAQDGVTVDEVYYFDAAALSYTLNPALDDKNTISYTLKISGDIVYVDSYVP